MSKIFNKIGRDKIRERLLESGFKLIKRHGLKKTSVAEIAKRSGVSTGTFYNFFPSKDEFVYQLVLHQRFALKGSFDELVADGKADREHFREYLRKIYFSDCNVFDYLSPGEIDLLNARWPEEYWKSQDSGEKTTRWLLENLEGARPECDWMVLANLSKSVALVRYGRSRLYEARYAETLEVHIDAIIRYVFG